MLEQRFLAASFGSDGFLVREGAVALELKNPVATVFPMGEIAARSTGFLLFLAEGRTPMRIFSGGSLAAPRGILVSFVFPAKIVGMVRCVGCGGCLALFIPELIKFTLRIIRLTHDIFAMGTILLYRNKESEACARTRSARIGVAPLKVCATEYSLCGCYCCCRAIMTLFIPGINNPIKLSPLQFPLGRSSRWACRVAEGLLAALLRAPFC